MKLEFYPAERLRKEVLDIVGRYLDIDLYKPFFFGSRVKGDSLLRADIDIGIEGPEELPCEIKLKIEEEINELPTLYKIDLVDFKNISVGFREEAMKQIETLR
ncbi:nucleotidyltransferase domain-containing protein [bacterium]|nr:nucleotidyltransferase domain-containing protein [bacterium]MBU1599546.1 nucleotidyltransferase domain-containing protein [bacterium]MBU2461906.1 nucleotidyltransferase domain-containing protein [bacterium]